MTHVSTSAPTSQVHSLPPAQWLPVAGAFAVQGLLFIGMTTHLPALQHRFDAASNMQGIALEHRAGRTLLPRLHAGWTTGGILATVLALLTGDAPLAWAVAPLAIVPVLLLTASSQRHDTPADAGETITVPWRQISLVGAALALFYMVDTAAATWGPVFLHTVHGLAVGFVAWATLPYLVATLAARIGAAATLARLGGPRTISLGALIAAAALALLVASPSAPVAVAAFALLGLGVGVIAPLSFTAAARLAGGPGADRARLDAVVARFNQFNYAGALIGAVMTGLVGSGNLRLGFAVPMVLILGILPLARQFATR